MKRPHDVIYVPGLGDDRLYGQDIAVKFWRVFGVHGHCHPVIWGDKEPFAPKLESIVEHVDELLAKDHTVSLAASSAGGSAALNAFAARKDVVNGLVVICAKIQHPETVEEWRYEENPAFQESLEMVPESLSLLSPLHLERCLSIRPRADEVVPVADMRIPGSYERTIPTRGHALSIAAALTVCSYITVNFLTRRA